MNDVFEEADRVRIWNPRYLAYARTHDRSPDEQLAHDEEAWPGGKMVGFSLWINAQWFRWFELHQPKLATVNGEYRMYYTKEFDAWLETTTLERLPSDPAPPDKQNEEQDR